jgi:hypothetical protein
MTIPHLAIEISDSKDEILYCSSCTSETCSLVSNICVKAPVLDDVPETSSDEEKDDSPMDKDDGDNDKDSLKGTV